MDRQEKPRRRSDFADQGLSRSDARVLGSPTGREAGNDPDARLPDDVRRTMGARPRSDVTGKHDAGSGASETTDGLEPTDETTRRNAEEVPLAPEPEDRDEAEELRQEGAEEAPVFDEARKPPRT